MGSTDAEPITVIDTGEPLVIRMCKNRRKGLTTRPDVPNIQAAQTAFSYETAVPDGGRLELKPPKGYAKARSFHCAGVPGRPERFRRRHPKAPGLWDDPIDDPEVTTSSCHLFQDMDLLSESQAFI